ncbi:hypothetical protein DFJ74DRAFT_436801 [Hyaloraphidium curvatum]|nr:hypothetical protein DFJ74DRAFT_436801 [Hyaloraphidium curvatum]
MPGAWFRRGLYAAGAVAVACSLPGVVGEPSIGVVWATPGEVSRPQEPAAQSADLVLCRWPNGSSTLFAQTFYDADTGNFQYRIEIAPFDPATGAQLGRAKSDAQAANFSSSWFSNAQHADRFACNGADGVTPMWIAGRNMNGSAAAGRFSQDGKLASTDDYTLASTSQYDSQTLLGVVSGPGTDRFLLYSTAPETGDLGSDKPGFQAVLRVPGAGTNDTAIWQSNFQLPLLTPSNNTRTLSPNAFFYDTQLGVFVIGQVFLGDPVDISNFPLNISSDIPSTVGGVTDLFALRYDGNTGQRLAQAQFGTNLTDRSLAAFPYQYAALPPRIGVIVDPSTAVGRSNATLAILDAATLGTVFTGPLKTQSGDDLPSFAVRSASASPSGEYFLLLGTPSETLPNGTVVGVPTAFVYSLTPETQGALLAQAPLNVSGLQGINWEILRSGGREGPADIWYFTGYGGFGNRPGTGNPQYYVGKIAVRADGNPITTVLRPTSTVAPTTAATGTAVTTTAVPTTVSTTSSRPSAGDKLGFSLAGFAGAIVAAAAAMLA